MRVFFDKVSVYKYSDIFVDILLNKNSDFERLRFLILKRLAFKIVTKLFSGALQREIT